MQNSCSYYFLWMKRNYLQFQENAWKNFLNKFTFNTVTFQVFFFQGFYLNCKLLLLLHLRFPRACIFQNISFSHCFMVAVLGITRQLTRWEALVLLILFTFLGCLRLSESSIKVWVSCLWGKIKSLIQHLVVDRFQTWSLKFNSVLVFHETFK